MSKVSILMAAYNAARYLDKSIGSVLAQTMTDWQLVVADDASTDQTPQLLARYTALDPRIRVVTLAANGGIAKARNAALSVADGDYICMLDSDDWLSPDALWQAAGVLDRNPDTDTVLFQVDMVGGDDPHMVSMPDFETLTGTEAFEASLSWRIHGIYMVRASLHHRYPYDESLRLYSDENVTRIHYLRSRLVRQCQGIYYYLQHAGSATHRVDASRFDFLTANASMRRMMDREQVPARAVRAYERLRWLNLVDAYMFYHDNRARLSDEDRAYGLRVMRQAWRQIETRLVPRRLRLKPGYMPLKPSWTLFRLQEEAYFGLRRLLGR